MWPHRRQPTRLPRPWDSPGKNTGAGCHFLLQCMKVKSESEVAQSCPTLSDPKDCSLPGSSIHGIFQARILEWGAIAFSHNVYPSPKKLWKWQVLLTFVATCCNLQLATCWGFEGIWTLLHCRVHCVYLVLNLWTEGFFPTPSAVFSSSIPFIFDIFQNSQPPCIHFL